MIQSVFIHGLAGVALLGLTAALWNYLAAGDTAVPRRVMLAAGVLAAVISFLQVGFMIGIYVHVGQHGSADGTRTPFDAINKADTVTPLGFTRLLLSGQKMPLYPEQARYKAAVSPPKYDRWMTEI
jgi:hypothetical protein